MARFAWTEFFRLAQQLSADRARLHDDEALRRTAASRAYYACYHCALALARRRGYNASAANLASFGVHERLIRWMQSQDDRTLAQVGGQLLTLKALRVDADYFSQQFSPESTATAVAIAKRLLRHLGTSPPT